MAQKLGDSRDCARSVKYRDRRWISRRLARSSRRPAQRRRVSAGPAVLMPKFQGVQCPTCHGRRAVAKARRAEVPRRSSTRTPRVDTVAIEDHLPVMILRPSRTRVSRPGKNRGQVRCRVQNVKGVPGGRVARGNDYSERRGVLGAAVVLSRRSIIGATPVAGTNTARMPRAVPWWREGSEQHAPARHRERAAAATAISVPVATGQLCCEARLVTNALVEPGAVRLKNPAHVPLTTKSRIRYHRLRSWPPSVLTTRRCTRHASGTRESDVRTDDPAKTPDQRILRFRRAGGRFEPSGRVEKARPTPET